MESFNIGKHLKNIRQNRELSLNEAAEMTGVSKPMLGQIERGQSSPTITTLWKIATGLKVPLSSFLQEEKTKYSVVDLSEQNAVLAENGAMRESHVVGKAGNTLFGKCHSQLSE